MVRGVTIHANGRGYATRPALLLDDGRCRCGSAISALRLVRGGAGLTPTGRILVYGAEGGAGFEAVWSQTTAGGALTASGIRVLTRGFGYARAETLRWELICFNETTSSSAVCSGGEQLEFDVGHAANVTGGADRCIGFLWADGAVVEPAPKSTVFSFELRNRPQANNGSALALSITAGAGSPAIAESALGGELVCWSRTLPGFDIKWIGSTNSIRDAITMITVTLQPNADLLPGEQVFVQDLLGSGTPSGGIIIDQIDTDVFQNQPSWDQGTGTLLLTIKEGRVMSRSVRSTFRLPLRNSAAISIGVQPR